MTKIFFGTALSALALVIPAAASAQRIAPAVVAVVDTDRIARECTACRAASAQLQSQEASIRSRAQALQTQIRTQGQPIEAAVAALNGKQPDAALKQRITALQTQERNAQTELATAQRNYQSSQVHVSQQIRNRVIPIIGTVAQSRGAGIAIDRGAALYSAPAMDITTEVLAQLNRALPSVSVTPLPQQAQQPTGR
jgi:Skp family chaperone for outer membrane proteins